MSHLYILTAVNHALFHGDPDEDDVLFAGSLFATPEAAAIYVDLELRDETDELNEENDLPEPAACPVPEWEEVVEPCGLRYWHAYVEETDTTYVIREKLNPLDL